MENNGNPTNNNRFVIICLVIVIIALIGVIAFMFTNMNNTSLNNGNNQNNNSVNNETDNDNSNDNNNEVVTKPDFKLEDAENLFDKVVGDPTITYVIMHIEDELKVSDMNTDQLGAFVLLNLNKEDYITNICGTQNEKDLLDLGVISSAGQVTCSNIVATSTDKVDAISENLFGKKMNFTPTEDKSFYYYEKGQIVHLLYTSTSTYPGTFKLTDHYIDGDMAIIETSWEVPSTSTSKYKIAFETKDNNYYLYSISKG